MPPVSLDVSRGEAVVNCAGAACLTTGHMGEDILHGPAAGEGALPLLPVPPDALVGVEEQHQLMLNQLPLLRVRRRKAA